MDNIYLELMSKESNMLMKFIKIMNFFYEKKIPLLPKLFLWMIRILFSADIPLGIKIGKGSIIKHNGLGVVLHNKCVIGENVTIMQNVTIGGRNGRGAPILENNVFVGVGACILGNVIIGENSMIGANAVVIKDVPKNVVVGGIPAKIIKEING